MFTPCAHTATHLLAPLRHPVNAVPKTVEMWEKQTGGVTLSVESLLSMLEALALIPFMHWGWWLQVCHPHTWEVEPDQPWICQILPQKENVIVEIKRGGQTFFCLC